MKIGILGCGHMGSALASALIAKRIGTVIASNPHKPALKLTSREKKFFHWTVDNRQVAKNAGIIIVAVKPGMVEEVLTQIRPLLKKTQLIISIAAGVPIKKLSLWSGHKKIIRVMPNLPAQVWEGVSVWKAGFPLTAKEKNTVEKLLTSFGHAYQVENEKLIDVATAVTGSGPAYVAAFLETLAKFSEKNGFSAHTSRQMALRLLKGTTVYIQKIGIDFGALKRAVQTKGGTTEAAFKILKKKNWQGILEKGLASALKMSRDQN